MNPRVVTVTANPALDVTSTVDRLEPDEKLRAHDSRVDPGGGGVNVARLVHRLGGETLAVVALGGATGHAYLELLEGERVPHDVVEIAGTTRQNFAVHEQESGHQYRFVLEGPTLDASEWAEIVARTSARLRPDDWLVVSGSMPAGAPEDAVAQLVRLAHDRGAHSAVDTSQAALAAALAAGPELIKPSRREFEQLLGRAVTDAELVPSAQALIADHGITMVVITLGREGALLVTRDEVVRLPAVPVQAVSTVGAGDSFLAGLVHRLAHGASLAGALRTALAAGAATAAGVGTRLADAGEIARLEATLPA